MEGLGGGGGRGPGVAGEGDVPVVGGMWGRGDFGKVLCSNSAGDEAFAGDLGGGAEVGE